MHIPSLFAAKDMKFVLILVIYLFECHYGHFNAKVSCQNDFKLHLACLALSLALNHCFHFFLSHFFHLVIASVLKHFVKRYSIILLNFSILYDFVWFRVLKITIRTKLFVELIILSKIHKSWKDRRVEFNMQLTSVHLLRVLFLHG